MVTYGRNDVSMSEIVEAHLRFLRAERQSGETIYARERLLLRLHEVLSFGIAYASTDELEAWLVSDPSWSAWTQSTYAMHIRAFYQWARGRFLTEDPTLDMAKPKRPDLVPKPVTEEQLAIALDRSAEPWRTLIILAAFAGLRASEAAGVRREHVNKDRIWIPNAKGGSPASVDTHPFVWRIAAPRPPGPLAQRASGLPVNGKWIGKHGRAHFDGIGLPGVTLHWFRHRFGTALLDGGNDLRTVQEAMRHRSVTSTQGYTLVSGGQRRLAIKSLPAPEPQNPDEN
jgi:integrase